MITPNIKLYQSTARVAALLPISLGDLERLLQCGVGVAPMAGVLAQRAGYNGAARARDLPIRDVLWADKGRIKGVGAVCTTWCLEIGLPLLILLY
jgi:hypothetical protein